MKIWLSTLLAASLSLACAPDDKDLSSTITSLGKEENVLAQQLETAMIPVNLGASSGFALSSNMQFLNLSVELQGCGSGLSGIWDLSSQATGIELYLFDRNCIITLVAFDYNGETFTLASGETFDPNVDAVNRFVGSSTEILVRVTAQLSQQVQASDTVSFEAFKIEQGGQLQADVDENILRVEPIELEVDESAGTVGFRVLKVTEKNSRRLNFSYTLSGGAVGGEDYIVPGSFSERIERRETFTEIYIDLIDDGLAEFPETLTMTLEDDNGYLHYGSATVLITDTDTGIVSNGQGVWLKADSLSLSDGASVADWSDQSGYGNHASQSSSSQRPIYQNSVLNGKPALYFDGSNDMLTMADSDQVNIAGPYDYRTIYLAFQTGTSTMARQMIFEEGGSVRGLSIYLEGGELYLTGWNENNDDGGLTTPWNIKSVTVPVEVSQSYVVALEMDAPQGEIRGYLNGNEFGRISGVGRLFTHTDDIGFGGIAGSTLFADGTTSGNYYFQGYIAEFLLYNGMQTNNERASILNYLVTKYISSQAAVSVFAASSSVTENSANPIELTFSMPTLKATDLTIFFQLSGSAQPGSDYQSILGSVTIPALQSFAVAQIYLIDDQMIEPNETITVTILPDPAYEVAIDTATVLIYDNENFTPSENPSLWLQADYGKVLDGNERVESWQSLVNSSALDISQGNSNYRPAVTQAALNGFSALSFDGVDDHFKVANTSLINSGGPWNGRYLSAVITTSSDISSNQLIYEEGAGTRGIALYISGGYLYFNSWNYANDDGGATTPWGHTFVRAPISANTSYLVTGIYDQPSNLVEIRLNGQSLDSTSGVGLIFSHTGGIGIGAINGTTVLHDGSSPGSGLAFSGQILEMILYSQSISMTELQAFETYALQKFGL